mgnify:CR=1 FL=1
MKKYLLHLGQTTSGKNGFSLGRNRKVKEKNLNTAATRKDIKELEKNLIWPPAFTRDINLVQMQQQKDSLDRVWGDSKLDPTTKLIQAGYHSHLFAIANKKYFNRSAPGAKLLTNKATSLDEKDLPPNKTPISDNKPDLTKLLRDAGAKVSPRYNLRKKSSPAYRFNKSYSTDGRKLHESDEEFVTPKIKKKTKRMK